jgi:uncharacterized protein
MANSNSPDLNTFPVEVVYLGKEEQFLIRLDVPKGCTVRQALIVSNLLSHSVELNNDLENLEGRIGIFGKLVTLETILKPGDRIEIYRFLHFDPMEARRKRAKKHPIRSSRKLDRL